MGAEKQAEPVRLYVQANEAANPLHGMARQLEELTKDTTIRYAVLTRWRRGLPSSRQRIYALEEMGKEMRGE